MGPYFLLKGSEVSATVLFVAIRIPLSGSHMGGFLKLEVLSGSPCNEDPSIFGPLLGPPFLETPRICILYYHNSFSLGIYIGHGEFLSSSVCQHTPSPAKQTWLQDLGSLVHEVSIVTGVGGFSIWGRD